MKNRSSLKDFMLVRPHIEKNENLKKWRENQKIEKKFEKIIRVWKTHKRPLMKE